MIWLLAVAAGPVVLFGFVILFGAPYLPTLRKPGDDALDLLALKPGQTFVDLGCGDGRMLALAANRGLDAVGYELNPLLAAVAWLRTRRYGRKVKIKLGDFWRADLSGADGVFVFLIGHFMERLDKKLRRQAAHGTIRVVSNSFKIPGRKPARQKGALYLYIYKAD